MRLRECFRFMLLLSIALLAMPYMWAEGRSDYNGQIASVVVELIGRGGEPSPLRLPALQLGSSEALRISFDLLGEEQRPLVYRLRHTSHDAQPTDILPSEALEHWAEGDIQEVQASRGTAMPYVHYSLELSPERVGFRLSGRYELSIYPWGSEEAILTMPIYVYEGNVSTRLSLGRSYLGDREATQALSLDLQMAGELSSARAEELYIELMQNASRTLPIVALTTPSERNNALWRYTGARAGVFAGGNEYRAIEHITRQAMGRGLEDSRSLADGLSLGRTLLETDRRGTTYTWSEDRNGIELIRSTHTPDARLEGEYHIIEFRLASPQALEGDVVLEGQAFEHIPLSGRTLRYDSRQGVYSLSLALKNGYQEYRYLLKPHDGSPLRSLDGDHYETSNRYDALIYYRGRGSRYERLLNLTTLTPAER